MPAGQVTMHRSAVRGIAECDPLNTNTSSVRQDPALEAWGKRHDYLGRGRISEMCQPSANKPEVTHMSGKRSSPGGLKEPNDRQDALEEREREIKLILSISGSSPAPLFSRSFLAGLCIRAPSFRVSVDTCVRAVDAAGRLRRGTAIPANLLWTTMVRKPFDPDQQAQQGNSRLPCRFCTDSNFKFIYNKTPFFSKNPQGRILLRLYRQHCTAT